MRGRFTWGSVAAVVLLSVVLCWRVRETGCKVAGGALLAAAWLLGLVGATGTGGRGGAVYASFLTTFVMGADIESAEVIVLGCKGEDRGFGQMFRLFLFVLLSQRQSEPSFFGVKIKFD